LIQTFIKKAQLWSNDFSFSLIELAQKNIHESLRQNEALRHRARMLWLMCYFFIGIIFIYMLGFLIAPIELKVKILIIGIWIFQIMAHSTVVYLLQVKGYFALAASLFLLSIAIIYFLIIFITGGPVQSPATEIIFVLPIIAFFLIGVRGGIIWTLIFLSILVLVFIVDKLGMPFINFIVDDYKYAVTIIFFYFGFIFIFSMIMLYENTFIGLQHQQHKSEAQTRHLANHDQLTGIANRTYFYEALDTCILNHQKSKKRFAFIYMDLVGFKDINDSYGHHVGDLVLQKIATRLHQGVRSTDLVARHGGDEFVFLLNNVKDNQAIEVLANKISALVSEPILVMDLKLQVFPSMGIAIFPDHTVDAIALERFSDEAMYLAKTKKCDWKIYEAVNS
jgi:diguanylate cyclase (GGDEF)-like protein